MMWDMVCETNCENDVKKLMREGLDERRGTFLRPAAAESMHRHVRYGSYRGALAFGDATPGIVDACSVNPFFEAESIKLAALERHRRSSAFDTRFFRSPSCFPVFQRTLHC